MMYVRAIRMKIRKAKEKDIDDLIPLCWQMHTSHYKYDKRYYKLAPKKKACEAIRKYFKKMINDTNTISLVAEDNGQLIGRLSARIMDRPPVFSSQKRIILEGCVVDEKYRSRGIYSRLQKRLEEIARSKKARYIELNVDILNDAKEAYKSKGYIPRHVMMVKEIKRFVR